MLLEDTSGEGHRTFIPGDADWLAMVVVASGLERDRVRRAPIACDATASPDT